MITDKKRLELLTKFIAEEKDTSMLYDNLGYPEQAKDEKKHSKFFEKERLKLLAKMRR